MRLRRSDQESRRRGRDPAGGCSWRSHLVEPAAESAPIRDRIVGTGEANAPHLLDVEVTSAFRRLVRQGRIGAARCHRRCTFLDLPIVRFPHSPLVGRIWGLQDGLSAYDATYVSLAERLGATLLTATCGCSPPEGTAPRSNWCEGPLDRFGDGGGAVGKDPGAAHPAHHFGSLP